MWFSAKQTEISRPFGKQWNSSEMKKNCVEPAMVFQTIANALSKRMNGGKMLIPARKWMHINFSARPMTTPKLYSRDALLWCIANAKKYYVAISRSAKNYTHNTKRELWFRIPICFFYFFWSNPRRCNALCLLWCEILLKFPVTVYEIDEQL